MTVAYVALGSNLPDRAGNLHQALQRLREMGGTEVVKASRVYETEPVGLADQPWFLNQVVSLDTKLSARQLLENLLAIENEMGRIRTVRWGPRVIDLDLLLYDEEQIAEPDLEVPHPRMWERRFVIAPLAEIAPELRGPGGRGIAEVVGSLPRRPVVRLYHPPREDRDNAPGGEGLRSLLSGSGEPVSGEEIARELGISRAAVWKRIDALRARGFVISGTPKRGYRVLAWPDRIPEFAPFLAQPRALVGRRVIGLESVDSTNVEIRRLALEGEPEGTVVLAERQTAGRGRRGRAWLSPGGLGLYMSVLLRPSLPLAEAPMFTPMAAVVAVRALAALGTAPGIKWPNDIVVGGRKLGGILLEVSGDPERIDFLTLGIGLNLNHQEADFPEELIGKATSALQVLGGRVNRAAVAKTLLSELDALYRTIGESGFAPVMEEYRRALVTLGREVRVTWEGGGFEGVARDIDSDGTLLVESDGQIRRVLSGDVSVRMSDGTYA